MKKTYTITNFAKRLALVLAVGLMAVNTWGSTINLTYTDVTTTSYSGSEATFTNVVQFGFVNLMRNGSNGTPTGWAKDQVLQQGSGGTLYNKAAISTISNIRVYLVANTNTFTLTYGTTTACNAGSITRPTTATGSESITYTKYENKTTTTGQTTTANYYDFDLSSSNPTYFKITNGAKTIYIWKVVITYSSGYAITWNNGGHGTAPISPTSATSLTLSAITGVTGYTCTGWKANVAVTNTSTSASIAANTLIANSTGVTLSQATTFTAQWSANNYTIDLNNQSATTAGTSSIAVTYDATTNLTGTPAITKPTKTHYDFGGYYTAVDGGGSQIIDANGDVVASVSNYTSSTKQWIKADNVTLYAKWTEHGLKNYRTVCCTELGTIDGEATLTQGGNSVTISGWSDVSNVGTYTVKLYKKNGASWDLVSGTTSGGSAGAQGTRTGITSGSKSVTYTGLEVESEYKFTVQAIAGSAAYCDGVETAVTEINSTDVSSAPFKFRYAIYIDDGTNDNYTYHYITSTGNTDEGSVTIDLNAHVDYYQFKIAGGFSGWWGQTGTSKIPASTEWELDGSNNVRLNTGAGGTYTFTVDYTSTNPAVTVTFPSADQDAGYVIYYDNSVLNWSNLYYRVGNNSNCSKVDVSLVPGTDKFYKVTTPDYDNMDAWHIANNYGWTGSNSIYRTKTSSNPTEAAKAITNSIAFQQYAVTEDITVIPTTTHSTGGDTGDAGNSNCEFYTINTPTSGMLTHNAAITSYSHGTVTVAYTNTSGSAASFTSGNADLAHRCKLTITATPATGYSLSSLQVNSSNFTSGNEHILTADATITAVFTAQTSTVTLQATSATTGSDQTVLATYDASMPLVTTADKTPAVAAISRTGYTFNGWWDATSGGKQYYSHSAGTIASANNWDKTGSQILYAQWIAKEYTISLDREGGSTGAESVTATFDSGTLTGWSAPTKTGYRFDGYYSGDNGTGTLVISSTGVLQNSVQVSSVNWTDASGHWIKDGGVTVYAKWTANEYTISYKDEGNVAYSGSNSALLPTTHTYGAATDLVDGVKSGYRFDGWFDNSSCTGDAVTSIGATAITANTTYYAKWTEVYTVTWHVGNGTWDVGEHNVTVGNTQVVSGSKIDAMPDAPADNTLSACASKFMGWSKKSWGSTPKTTESGQYDDLFTDVAGSPYITQDTTFYAVFAEQTNSDGYKYIGDDGTLADGKKYIFVSAKTAGSAYALKATDLAAPNSGNNGTAVSVTVTSNSEGILVTTVNTALEFEYVSSGSKLQYEVDGPATRYLFINGDGVGMKSDDNRSRYTTDAGLQGWNNKVSTYYDVYYNSTNEKFEKKESAGSRVYAFIKQTPTYANYRTQCDVNLVKVTYDANGGSTTCADGSHDKRNDYTVCATEPSRDYYTFAGWLCSADDEVYDASATIDDAVIDADFTLTAQWTPVPYDITYNLYGGTNSGSNPATYNVETATITLQDPTKGHDRFEGWFSTYSAGVYSDQVTSIPLGSHGDITLHAKWAERHEIIFDADGTTTTIYRADDEDLSASVAGQGSVPNDPDAPSACSTKVFVGWSESEIDDETDDEPADLMKPAAGTVNADKHYYAVWATESSSSGPVTVFNDAFARVDNGTAYGNKGKYTTSYVFGTGTAGEARMSNSSSGAGSIDIDLSDKTLESTLTITFKLKYWDSNENGSVSLTCMDEGATASFGSSPFAYPTTSGWQNCSSTVTGVNSKVKSINFGSTAGKRVYIKDIVITQTGTIYSYSAYSTSCCATKVTLSQNDPENGTIAFGKTSVGTCGGDKDVSLTITPAAGYQLATYSVATGDGKVATKTDPGISLDNNSSAVQNKTLTFASGASGAYDVTASFSEMVASAWTWTKHVGGAAITTDPVEVYVGQKVQVDVSYEPAGLLSNHTNASAYNYSPSPWSNPNLGSPAKAGDHLTVTGTNAGSTSVVLNHNDGLTKTIYYTVLALPLVHFVDNIHGETFANVVATVSGDSWTVTTTLPTPTHSAVDDPGASYNTCERQHLHLIGWIESEWADAHPNAEPGDITGAGAGNYYAAGANIDLVAQNGKTFYAVWAKFE